MLQPVPMPEEVDTLSQLGKMMSMVPSRSASGQISRASSRKLTHVGEGQGSATFG